MPKTAASSAFSKDFPLDSSIFPNSKLSLSASTDANASAAILTNKPFPDGNIELGHISFTADTGQVSFKPGVVGGASVSFQITASAQSGMGVYGKGADALKDIGLDDTPSIKLPDADGQRFLLMDWGYSSSFSGSASHPVGLLGSVSFGVDALHNSVYAVLHRFDAKQGAHTVLEDTFASWRFPRHVALQGGDVNLKPFTWVLAEADGSLAIKLAASLGWDMSFAKDAKLLGVTHNLSAKIDANLQATLGFNVAGKYVVLVGREDTSTTVRLRLFKQSSKGLNFGFDLNVGLQGSDPQLPTNFDDFIKSVFGVNGLQVLNDIREWTDPDTDLGQKLAGLADQTALDLVKRATGLNPATVVDAEFAKGKKIIGDALNTWDNLPDQVSSMVWGFLDQNLGAGTVADFKTLLTNLSDPSKAADTVAKALQKATFGDTPQGQFLEAVADRGLLALLTQLQNSGGIAPITSVASQVLDILNGGVIAKLQGFINEALDLDQIRKAVSDADFNHINQWLQARLANFLDKELSAFGLDEIKQVQAAIRLLDSKVAGYYKTAVEALTKRYSVDFAVTYQKTTTDTALIDVSFDLARKPAAALFASVVAQSNLDSLLTTAPDGVTLNMATLTHDINRKSDVELHMPFFDFTSTHVNDAVAKLTAEDHGGRLLLYQVEGVDKLTVANRIASQLSVLASLKVAAGQKPVFDTATGSISYEMRQVKTDMRPMDLEDRTTGFIRQYLRGLFHLESGENAIHSFYTDLDIALSAATHNASNRLGDLALCMQVSLPGSVLGGWFQARSDSGLRADQMKVSLALQTAWKQVLPAMFFQNLNNYVFNENVAALLMWAAFPVSTSIDFDGTTILQFNTNKDVFWDWPDSDLRHAVVRDPHTVATLGSRLPAIQKQLSEVGNGNAGFFDPSQAKRFVELALDTTGDSALQRLLFTEAQLVGGATGALKSIAATMANAATAPTRAIQSLSEFAADLTDTFNTRIASVYAGVSGQVLGPMLLVEASNALGFVQGSPAALLNVYAMNPGHAFNLGDFVDGVMPPEGQVALTQTLVSVS